VLRPTLGYTLVVATGDLAGKFKGMIKLNETSADIWRWIDEGKSREEVIANYKETYSVDEATASHDYDQMVGNMRAAGVLESDQ